MADVDLPKDDAAYEEELRLLRTAIEDGDKSGIAEGDVFAEIRARFNLPPRDSAQ